MARRKKEASEGAGMETEKKEEKSLLDSMWKYYHVEMRLKSRIYGGLPKDPKLVEGFLKGKGVAAQNIAERTKLLHEQIDSTVPEDKKADDLGSWTCFKKDENGLYIETRQIKALLKEACSASEVWKKFFGLKSRIGDQLFPVGQGGDSDERIYLVRDGKVVKEPDGREDSPARVKGMQGERSILKMKDYVEKPTISFDLKVASGSSTIKDEVLQYLFEYGTEIGVGADRSCEKGKFVVVKIEKKNKL